MRRRPGEEHNDAEGVERWHSLDSGQTVQRLATHATRGLAPAEARARLARYGANQLAAAEQRGLAAIVAGQFTDVMILVLLAAAVLSGVLGELRDAAAIVVIVVLNAIVGATQEYRAQRTIAALREMSGFEARVVRSRESVRLPAAELVPGDLVALEAGDVVPADLRLLETQELSTDESTLTGESMPVMKNTETLPDQDVPVGDRRNIAFKSSAVTKGTGAGIVVGTGLSTEIGRIAQLLAEKQGVRTPLQQRLAAFGRRLAVAVLAICSVIFVLGLVNGQPPLLMFLTAVSLAVAAVPEALPAVITISLAVGSRILSRQRTLVRRLPAVETLGSVTYICADKTGTLTENRMTLAAGLAGDQAFERISELGDAIGQPLGQALALCNDISTPDLDSGDPTEAALARAAADAGFTKAALLEQLPLIGEITFDSDRKLMTTLHKYNTELVAFTKGAPEQLVARCKTMLSAAGQAQPIDAAAVLAQADDLARRGYRVLGAAMRRLPEVPHEMSAERIETQMTFLGFVGLHDPVRAEVPQAIADCRSAGITPVMITGDHPQTARRIAEQLGMSRGAASVLTGRELAMLSDDELSRRVRSIQVYARVDPAQKLRIVEALQQTGEFVAMTGDGVNDAPALKQASIGIAMGRRGTDVAREAADMVLLDDNFATIVAAVREGRRVYDNIRKFIKYTMTSNSGEIWVLFLAPFLGLPIPLLPIHILWINLVTDGLPGLAFSTEPAEPDVMRRAPRPPRESVFARGMWQHMLWVGLLIGGLSLATAARRGSADIDHWQTMVFTTLVTAQLFHALAVRSEKHSLWRIGAAGNLYLIGAVLLTLVVQLAVLYVPALNPVLRTVPLPLPDLLFCLALGLIVLPAVEVEKWLVRRRYLYSDDAPRRQYRR